MSELNARAQNKLDEIEALSSSEYQDADIKFAVKNWEFTSDRLARRVTSWFKANAGDLTDPLQLLYLQIADNALKYIPDLGRSGQRFVLENLEESDLSTMIGKAHGYSVIVPDLWAAIISQLEAGTLSRRELAAYGARERLPRAFKIAIGAHNLGSTHMAGDGGAARGRRRSAESDVEAKRSSRSPKPEPVESPLDAFLSATRSAVQQEAAEILLKSARSVGIKLSSASRAALKAVIAAEGSSEIRASFKIALRELAPKPARQPKPQPESDQGSRSSRSHRRASKSAQSDYDIESDSDDQKPRGRRAPKPSTDGSRSRPREASDKEGKVSRRSVGSSSTVRKSRSSQETDFSDSDQVGTAVRRVRRPQL